jgi:hypothetical protein
MDRHIFLVFDLDLPHIYVLTYPGVAKDMRVPVHIKLHQDEQFDAGVRGR